MDTSNDNWFVEQFHLRSPIEEFQESCRLEIERLRENDASFDDTTHREAVDLTLSKLRPVLMGAMR